MTVRYIRHKQSQREIRKLIETSIYFLENNMNDR